MSDARVRSFYRVTRKQDPPLDDDFYRTRRDKYPIRPEGVSDEEWNTWGALSFYDSEAGARRCGERRTHLGNKIIRFDFPAGRGITWDEPDDEGHQNVWGDKEVIARYRVADWVAPVKRADPRAAKGSG